MQNPSAECREDREGGYAIESTTEQPRPEATGVEEECPDVTVVIPAFNEEDAIAQEIEGIHGVLSDRGLRFEILVVDDGSSDATAERARGAPCRVISQPENRGYGAALKRGFDAARSELVVITDADGTYPAEEIPRLLERSSAFDMVVGSRTGCNVHDSMARRPARSFLRRLASYLAGQKIPDLNSGLRVIRRRDVRRFRHILPAGFSFTTTITLSIMCTDGSVGYVPIDYRKRVGKSKIRPHHAADFLFLILRVMVLFNPLKVFLPLGLVFFTAGLAKFIYDLLLADLSESAVMAFLAAFIIWAVGLLADQNARLGLDRWVNPASRKD